MYRIMGLGDQSELEINENGGKQSKTHYDFTLIPSIALFEVARVYKTGAAKYGKDNWKNISTNEHLNHLLIHVFAHLAGDRSEQHLINACCRALMALEMEISHAS